MLLVLAAAACGSTPIAGGDAGTQFILPMLDTTRVDKVDLLLMVDNGPSIGEKQDLVALAVPALLGRLVNPRCVSTQACTTATDCTAAFGSSAMCDGVCVAPGDDGGSVECESIPNTRPEFAPVHDMHIGVISSSLGNEGSPDVCVPSSSSDPTHQDDNGRLLNRTFNAGANTDGPPLARANPVDGNGGNFLAWLPTNFVQNAGKPAPNVTPYGDGELEPMIVDFESLIAGVQQHGCAFGGQMESWYRFLVQPDPFQSITTDGAVPPHAQYQGVDATLLKMRHDFLRPDSVVIVIDVTDHDQEWVDPLWLGGYGWMMHTSSTNDFGGPGNGAGPRGTSECDQPIDPSSPTTTGPNNPDCQSCAFNSNKPVAGTPIIEDPNCQSCADGTNNCPKPGWYTPVGSSVPLVASDGLPVHDATQFDRRRYGLDPHPNIQRYVDGLTSVMVPDRDSESHSLTNAYTPNRDCRNPLFAANLPDGSDTSPTTLCDLSAGPRTPSMIFFAHLGGVPSTLLEPSLSQSDWQSILGQDPDHYEFAGISPYMLQSIGPRQGLQQPGAAYTTGTDPVNGREWNPLTSASGIDMQYACTFELPAPKDCTASENAGACDCVGSATDTADGPPLCDATTRTTQVRGKAYPTITELRVAKALGSQAIVGSLCATDTNPADEALPQFGYNAIMNTIVDRVGEVLAGSANTCVGITLPVGSDGQTPCAALVTFRSMPQSGSPGSFINPTGACTGAGMSQPTADELFTFDHNWAQGNASTPPPALCVLAQLPANTPCAGGSTPGWCYLQGDGSTPCGQTIQVSGNQSPAATDIELECHF